MIGTPLESETETDHITNVITALLLAIHTHAALCVGSGVLLTVN